MFSVAIHWILVAGVTRGPARRGSFALDFAALGDQARGHDVVVHVDLQRTFLGEDQFQEVEHIAGIQGRRVSGDQCRQVGLAHDRHAMFHHGAVGFLPKSADAGTLGEAIDAVLSGDRWAPASALKAPAAGAEEHDAAQRVRDLTPQQFRVLQMLGDGLLNKQIAYELGVSEATIKAHMTAILRKLGANNRTQAVLIAGKLAIDPEAVMPPPEED